MMERFAINILHKRIYKICRLCGVDQPHKIPIVDGAETIIVGDEDEEASLAKKIEECVGIQVHKDDKMPQNICALCVDKINDFYEYRLMCAATNLQTRSILNLNLVEPSRKLLNFGEVSKVEDEKKEDVKKVVEVPTSSSSTTIPTGGKKGKKKRGPPSPSPSPAPTTRIKAPVDVKDEPVPAVPVKALTKKERLKQLQLQKEKDEKKKKEDEKKDRKEEKLKKEKVEVKAPEVNEHKQTRSKRKEPSPPKETEKEKVELTVPPPKKIKFEHPCSYCTDEFKTEAELDGHLVTKHTPLVRKFGCGSCRETFDTVLESKDHNLWHQLTRTLYTCFKCKKKYDKNLALVKHMALNACGRVARGRPPALLPDVQCRLCSKKFKTQNLYEWHGCFIKPKSNCPKCNKYFVKKQILTRHYMMFCTGTLPPPEPVIIPKVEPVDPAEKPAQAAVPTVAERRKRRVAFAEPELPKEEREIPFPPPLEPEAPASAPTPTPTPSGSKKKSKKDSTPNVTIKPVVAPPADKEKITSLLTTGAKLDRDSDIATINNLLSSVNEAIASISEAKAKKKKKKKDKNKDKAEEEAEVPAVEAPKKAASKPKEPSPVPASAPIPTPTPTPPPPAVEKTPEELEAYALAQEVGEMTLDQQLAFCSGKLPLVVLAKTTFKQEYTEIDTEPSQMQEPMENGDEEDNGYDDAANDYSGFQDDDDDEEQQPEVSPAEEEAPPAEDENQETEELQFPMPIKQEVEPEEPTIAPEVPQPEEASEPQPEAEVQSPAVVEAPKPSELQESLFDERLAVNIKKEPGLEEEPQQPAAKRKRPESRASAVASPASSVGSSRSAPQESPKLILKINKGLLNTTSKPVKSMKTIVLDDDDDEDEEQQRIPEPAPEQTTAAKKAKVYKKPDFLAVKIKQEKVDPAYESQEPTVTVHQVELPGGIRIKQERLDPDEEPHQAEQQEEQEEEEEQAPPPQKKSRISGKPKPASPVVAFDGVRIKQEKPDAVHPVVEMPSPAPAEDPKPQEKKKKSKGKINPFALLRQKMAAEAAAKTAAESAPPQAPSPLPVITNVVGNAPTPATSSSSNSSSGENTPMAESDTESDRRVPVIAQVASMAAEKVGAVEIPVAIKQEPVDEEPEEEEAEDHENEQQSQTEQEESPNQEEAEEAEPDFPMPIKQEIPEETPTAEEEEEESPNEAEESEEPEFPMPIKQEVQESQQEETNEETTESSEEEPERQEKDAVREKEQEVSATNNDGEKIAEEHRDGQEETNNREDNVPSSTNQDDEQEDEEESEQQGAEKEKVDSEQIKESRNEEEDEDEGGEEEEEEEESAPSVVEKKEDSPTANEESSKQNQNEEEDEDDGGEEEEEEEESSSPAVENKEDVPAANEESSKQSQIEEEDEDDGEEEQEEEQGPLAANEDQNKVDQNDKDEEEGEDDEEEETPSPAEEAKVDPPSANENQEEGDVDVEDEPELKELEAAQQRIEKESESNLHVEQRERNGTEDEMKEVQAKLLDAGRNPSQSNDEPENSTSPISDIPMDEYDQNSQLQEPSEAKEASKSQESALDSIAAYANNECNNRPADNVPMETQSSNTVSAPSEAPEPSSTSDGCADTRLESQLEELQNLLTEGLKPLPDSSQLPSDGSLAPVTINDPSMVQSSSIGSSVGNSVVGIGGLEDDLDSLLNNKLEEITAAQPMDALPPQDDLNLAIERELLHEMMPIGPEISAVSEGGTNSLLGVGQDLLLDGTGASGQQSS